MKCIVCGSRIEEGEDMLLVSCDGDFMHRKCRPRWEIFKTIINNMSDTEFRKYILGEQWKESEEV